MSLTNSKQTKTLLRSYIRSLLMEITTDEYLDSKVSSKQDRHFTNYDELLYTEDVDFCYENLDKILDTMLGSLDSSRQVIKLMKRLEGDPTKILIQLSYKNSDDNAFNDATSGRLQTKLASSYDLNPSGSIYKTLKSFYTSPQVFDRQIRIAKIRNKEELQATLLINPDLSYWVVSDCKNPALYGTVKRLMSGIGGTDLETGLGALLQITTHFPTAFRDVGKNIASLPPKQQEQVLEGLNFSTSVLGLTELGTVTGAAGAS